WVYALKAFTINLKLIWIYINAAVPVYIITMKSLWFANMWFVFLVNHNRRTRTERELKMKSTKTATANQSTRCNSSITSQPTSIASIPADIQLENR
uniref:Uncharacterized protein n=1 Tax=Xenopus tropicalis TaxID=8364 RepID=A0A6I8SXS7_XENTR